MPDDNMKPQPRAKADGYRSIYVNASVIGFSAWDIQMSLSVATGAGASQLIEDQVTVIQSPVHAKALFVSLGRTLAAYEAQHGPIPEIPNKKLVADAPPKPTTQQRLKRTLPNLPR